MNWGMGDTLVLLAVVVPFLCAGFYHLGAWVERENARRRADRALAVMPRSTRGGYASSSRRVTDLRQPPKGAPSTVPPKD